MNDKYGKFEIGESVILNESLVCEGIHFDKGHRFIIKNFPYSTIKLPSWRMNRFVYGLDDNNQHVRCGIDQIVKI